MCPVWWCLRATQPQPFSSFIDSHYPGAHVYGLTSFIHRTHRPGIPCARMCLIGVLCVWSLGQMACATGASLKAQDDQMTQVTSRLQEVERTNGRLTVRVEELEEQLFLANDRIEAHRLALQRQGRMGRSLAQASPRRPAPTSETYYPSQQRGVQTRSPQRQVTRIPLNQPRVEPVAPSKPAIVAPANAAGAGEEAEVVYTEARYRAFAGDPIVRTAPSSPGSSRGRRTPQPPVTSERLRPVSETPAAGQDLATKKFVPDASAPLPKSFKKGLAGYRDALAAYRAGNYDEARQGFLAFMSTNPKDDYKDNALYWIGECEYGLGEYAQSVRFFKRVLSEHPDGNKVPDAMLKMSLAFERLGKSQDAQDTFKSIVSKYPMTNAARVARGRLSE